MPSPGAHALIAQLDRATALTSRTCSSNVLGVRRRRTEVKKDKTLGYSYFLDTGHPLANAQGKVYLHRHVASLKVGRWLLPGEVVHHKDKDRSNNLPGNLEVLASHAEHRARHAPKRSCRRCGSLTYNKVFCSLFCAREASKKVQHPDRLTLSADIDSLSWEAVGRKYGVSGNAVKKWARGYELLAP